MSSYDLLFKEKMKEYRSLVEERLSGGLLKEAFKDTDDLDFMEKYSEAFRTFTEGGKRVRAAMVILGYNMCGCDTDKDIVTASLSYELFQSGILIHDDIIDESELRRNKPSMHVALGGGQSGISKAICVGDSGILTSGDLILMTGFEEGRKLKALSNQNKVFRLTIAGELKDIELSGETDPHLEDIIRMYELKTSWYTFIGPLQLGIILGGGDEKLFNDAAELGRLFGIAFQIMDDVLGIFGEEAATGKDSSSDMEEGKKTVLTCYFKDTASTGEKMEFDRLYGKGKLSASDADKVRQLLRSNGAREKALELCRKYTEEALSLIWEMDIKREQREILLGFLDYLNERQG